MPFSGKKRESIIIPDDMTPSKKRAKTIKQDPTTASVVTPEPTTTTMTSEDEIKTLVRNDLWSNDADVVSNALKKLGKLCSMKRNGEIAESNSDLFFLLGGHLATFKAMERFSDNVKIQERACLALAHTTNAGEDNVAEYVNAVDGAKRLLETMKKHPTHLSVQQDASCTLVNLTDGNKKVCEDILTKLDGVATIVASMEANDDPELHTWGCMIFENMCNHKELIALVSKAGARSAVTVAAEKYPHESDLQKSARKVAEKLWAATSKAPRSSSAKADNEASMSKESERIKKYITQDLFGPEKTVQDALEDIGQLCYVQDANDEDAFFALKDKADLIFRMGGHIAIIKTMEKWSVHANIQEKGCTALGNMLWDAGKIQDAVVAAGGIDISISGMKRFRGLFCPFQSSACHLLGGLAMGNESIAETIVNESDGCESIIHAMQSFPTDRDTQAYGSSALQELSAFPALVTDINNIQVNGRGARVALAVAAEKRPNDKNTLLHARIATQQLWLGTS